ncbi:MULTISPECIES: hypothetical protein [unclassified Luteococcus]|uniref:hypothetical protein n=1 Tax=unclassified Luteococcus TaxID=2639923 RepID=UPI00313C254F
MPKPTNAVHSSRVNLVAKPSNLLETVMAWQPLQLLTGIYGTISLGGHLYVTPTELTFIPHALNASHTELHLPLADIVGVRTQQKLLAALLVISTAAGEEIRLVSWSRDEVVAAVEQARGTAPSA